MSPAPNEVRALRLDVVRQARKVIDAAGHSNEPYRWMWITSRGKVLRGKWIPAEVRLIRNLILRDLQQLEYELRHGIGRRMPKKRRK